MDLKWVEKAYEKWIQGEDVNLDDVPSSRFHGIDVLDYVGTYSPSTVRSAYLSNKHRITYVPDKSISDSRGR